MNKHRPCRGKFGLRDPCFSDQALDSCGDFVTPRPDGEVHQKHRDHAQGHAHAERRPQLNPQLGNRAIDQEQPSQGQGHDSADPEHAVGGKLGLQREQHKGRHNQRDGGEPGRQKIEREDGKQNEYDPHHAGNHRARVIHFGIDGKSANRQQQERNIGVHQPAQDLLPERHGEGLDRLVGHVQRHRGAIETLHHAPIKLVQQILLVGRDDIDQLLGERLLIGPRARFDDRGLRQLHVAAALGNVGAQEGRSVILNLGLHRVVHLAARDGDARVAFADVGRLPGDLHVGFPIGHVRAGADANVTIAEADGGIQPRRKLEMQPLLGGPLARIRKRLGEPDILVDGHIKQHAEAQAVRSGDSG